MLKVKIVRVDVSDGKIRRMIDYVAEEKTLHVFLNRNHYATAFCSPSHLKELAVGNLISQGIIKSIEEIEKISLKKEENCIIKLKPNIDLKKRLKLSKLFSRGILSACVSPSHYQLSAKLPKIKSKLTVKAEIVVKSVNHLNSIAEIFGKTGGVHAAAIYMSDGNLVAFAEDVSRHNAVDKVIGIGALNKTDFNICFLTLTGRLTGSIVYKAAKVGFPIVASLAAAIDSGIAIAMNTDLTLIGFVRGRRMNIYNFPERILS